MKRVVFFLILLGFLLFFTNKVYASTPTTITLNETNNGNVGDSYTKSYAPDTNYGISNSMWVHTGDNSTSNKWNGRTYIMWDLSVVPSGATINNANLSLFLATNSLSRNLQAYNTSNGWHEYNITWNNQPSTSVLQSTTASGSASNPNIWIYWNVTNAVVFQYSQASKNVSIVIKDSVESDSVWPEEGFFSKEYTTTRPQLVITYTPANTAPTITSNTINTTSPVYGSGVKNTLTCSDADTGDTITYGCSFYRNDVNITAKATSGTISSGVATSIITLVRTDYGGGDTLIIGCKCSDGTATTSETNTSTATATQATPSIFVAPLTSVTYGTSTQTGCQKVSGDPSGNISLYRNGTLVNSSTTLSYINESSIILGVATNNYTCEYYATQNYTAGSSVNNFRTVNPASQSISLTGVTNSTYPYSVTPVCIGNITANLFRNDSSATNNSAIQLGVATYLWTCNTTLNSNYTFNSVSVLQVVSIGTPSIFVAPLTTVNFGTFTQTGCERVAGDPSSILTLLRNGTQVNQSATSPINETNTTLPAGVWTYTCTQTDTQNYSSGITANNYLTVNHLNANVQIFPTTATQNYPYNTSQYCTSDYVACSLYRNSVLISNNTYYQGAAGTYNYVANISDNANYTNWNATSLLTINKITPTIDITWTNFITYGTAGDATSVETNDGDGDVSYNFYREDPIGSSNYIPVSSPDTTVLGVGSWNYRFTASGGQNYTDLNLTKGSLTVNTAPASINLLLNGTDGNITIPNNSVVNVTAISNVASAILYEYSDVVNIGVGKSPLETMVLYSGTDSFINLTASLSSNYTYNFSTHWIYLDASYPLISNVKPENTTYGTMSVPIEAFVSKNSTIKFSINNTANHTLCSDCISNSTTVILENGFYNITFYWNSSANYNSSVVYFSVNTIFPSIIISSPTSVIYPANPIQINVTLSENCTLKYNYNGTNVTQCQNCSEWGNSSLQYLPALSDGVYTLRFYLNDSNGRSATDFVVFSLSTPIITTTIPQLGGGGVTPNIIGNATTFAVQPLSYTLSVAQGETKIIAGIGRSTTFTIVNKGPDVIHLKAYFTGADSSWAKFLYPTANETTDVIFFDIKSGESKDIIAQVTVPLNATTGNETKIQFVTQDVYTAAYNTADVVVQVGPSYLAWIWNFLTKPLNDIYPLHVPGNYPLDLNVPWRIVLAFFVGLFLTPLIKRIKILKDKRGSQSILWFAIILAILYVG